MNNGFYSHNGSVLTRFFKVTSVARKELGAFKKFLSLSNSEREISKIPLQFVNKLLGLGPTFIKLGQILSTRPDILPKEYILALKVLHDDVPPFKYEKAKEIVQEELKTDLDSVFREFEEKPVAAASLSQVHFAILKDGSEVAVKIQRPLTKDIINKDLMVLAWLVKLMSIFKPGLAKNLDFMGAFNEFKRYTLQELDFACEGRTLEQFRYNFIDWKDVIFPKVYWDFTTNRVLTMERVSGLKLHEVKDKLTEGNLKILNKRLIELEMKMFITDAFFHADLHPGNIFFQEDGSISIIDVGMFGELEPAQRDRFLLYWLAIAQEEKKRAFHHLIKLGKLTPDANEDGFYQEFSRILDHFYESDISTRSLTKTYLDIFIAGAKFGFSFPSQLLLQAKALTTAEALAFVLVPDFRFNEEVRPIVTRELGKRAKPEEVKKRLKQTFPEWLLLGETVDVSVLFSNDEKEKSEKGWLEIAKSWARALDENRLKDNEVKHGEYEVIVNESLDKVFNFVTRFAQYPNWHPTYTDESRVIHVAGRYVFLTPEVTGSIFRLDEIVDGNLLLSNGEVTAFERNKMYKWRAPLSICPIFDIGTCFYFEDLGNNQTRLYEYFYYEESPVSDFLVNRYWHTAAALTAHIKEELTGVKNIMESRKYNPEDIGYLWANVNETTRLLNINDLGQPVKQSRQSDYI